MSFEHLLWQSKSGSKLNVSKSTVEIFFKATEMLVFPLVFRLSKLNPHFQTTQAFPYILTSQNARNLLPYQSQEVLRRG